MDYKNDFKDSDSEMEDDKYNEISDRNVSEGLSYDKSNI